MVAVSHSPHSEVLVRATRRLAYGLGASWLAVHVDTGVSLSAEDRATLSKNQELGQVVIHKQDGTIQTEHTYGKDPYPPKG